MLGPSVNGKAMEVETSVTDRSVNIDRYQN